ncbi:iron-sulfer cluster proteins NifU [Legionella wadsworthii]|uniref:Iron-sulfer cluster proteins NifU n=1 Tax=Legionella wadsworthii TaxID=28088 RepID=A0A378LQW4_9GAMM|nr:iron-sulfur cluster assembly scaffold protein [Legionella wadsworthii]STY29107.1 iron-sulfer cluster proteins NifU [Legionella wadsworthii]
MYNRLVHDYFFKPRHVGEIDLKNHFAVVAKNHQKGQGMIELYLQCNSNGTIVRACFRSSCNPFVIAGLEWLCRFVEGKSIHATPQIDYQLIVKELEIPLTQYPLAIRIKNVYEEALLLMKRNHQI